MFKKICLVCFCVLGFQSSVFAASASVTSIEILMNITNAEKLTVDMLKSMDIQFERLIAIQSEELKLTKEQQGELKDLMTQTLTLMKDELAWQKLKPLYIRVYQESLTQEEVDGLIAFYKSPAGIALTKKIPIIMEKSAKITEERLIPMIKKMNQLLEQNIQKKK